MKAYTDIEQSKKLAEILPLESADMCYRAYREEGGIPDYGVTLCPYQFASWIGVPCWSLAALLEGVLPLEAETHKQTDGHKIYYYVETYMRRKGKEIYLSTQRHENLIDACVEMILKLKEKDLIWQHI